MSWGQVPTREVEPRCASWPLAPCPVEARANAGAMVLDAQLSAAARCHRVCRSRRRHRPGGEWQARRFEGNADSPEAKVRRNPLQLLTLGVIGLSRELQEAIRLSPQHEVRTVQPRLPREGSTELQALSVAITWS